MTKQPFVTLLLLFLSTCTYAQETYTVTYRDGTEKQTTFFDDPARLPAFEIGLSPFAIAYMPKELFGFKIRGVFRANDKLFFDAGILSPYGKEAHENRGTFDAIESAVFDITANGHFEIWNASKTKDKKTPVEYNPNLRRIYQATLPRSKRRAVFVDGGLNYNSSNSRFVEEHEFNATGFAGGGISSLSLIAGASYQFTKSYKSITDGKPLSYVRTGRWYANVSYGILSNYTIYRYTLTAPENPGEGSTATFTDHTSNFQDLKFRGLGWRIGFIRNHGFRNSGHSASFGFEAGALPNFFTGDLDHKSPLSGGGSTFFSLQLGINLGTNPWK